MTTEKTYFNTRTQGLAFLNEVSEKQTTEGAVLKVKLSALNGPEDKVSYEKFVLYVKGNQASEVITGLREHLTKDNKITVSFVASNCKAKAFIPESGDKAGQLVTYQEGSLIFITSARLNGEEVYRAPEKAE